MKKLYLLGLLLFSFFTSFGQFSRLSSATTGRIVATDPSGNTTTEAAARLFFRLEKSTGKVRIDITGGGITLTNDLFSNYRLDGIKPDSIGQIRDWLLIYGAATFPVGAGGGGGGGTSDASAAKQDQQTALQTAINNKVSTAVRQDTIIGRLVQQVNLLSGVVNKLNSSIAVTGAFFPATQPVSGSINVSNFPSSQDVNVASSVLPVGAATQTTLAAVLSKLIADPSTQGKQDALNAIVAIIQTNTLNTANSTSSIDAKTSTLVTNTTKQQALYTPLSTSLTTSPAALPSAAAAQVEIKNNATGAVDIFVVKSGGSIETVPAGAVTRFDGLTNANQLSVYSSTGTPTVFYRLYTQLMQ